MDSKEYPDGNPKSVHGEAKPGISSIPPVYIVQLGQAMAEGKRKYGRMNWRDTKVDVLVYYDAAQRHQMAWLDGENLDRATGIPHLAMAGACFAIIQDAIAHNAAIDNRVKGAAPDYIAEHTVEKPLLAPVPAATISDVTSVRIANDKNIRVKRCDLCLDWRKCKREKWCDEEKEEVADIESSEPVSMVQTGTCPLCPDRADCANLGVCGITGNWINKP